MQKLIAALALVSLLAACGTQPQQTASYQPGNAVTTQDEFACLREAVYYEAHAHSTEGQLAVAHVILNRVSDPRFPQSICGVVGQGEAAGRCQFSYRCDGRAEAFGDDVKYRTATRAAKLALENQGGDVSRGALYFHAASMPPGWFGTLNRTTALGGNIFYKG